MGKNLKISIADSLRRILVFLAVIVVSASTGESFSSAAKAEFKQTKIYKKMNQTGKKEIPPGDWGGAGIKLGIKEETAIIEFDCAEAEIAGKLMIDKKGNFNARGTYLKRYAGAIRTNLPLKSQPAKFSGKISGKKMLLKVTLQESGEVVGNYTLNRGETGKIRKCL